ncbi:hypothetical protein [Cruoricaptor ignavus]|uniref:hypothetical protein n=1 Tax=Cruoricaptor ignavus TaxID=1118202 RepID=UPI001356413F|nr:hypothetical protein [Cruoricaptor ignavus]
MKKRYFLLIILAVVLLFIAPQVLAGIFCIAFTVVMLLGIAGLFKIVFFEKNC